MRKAITIFELASMALLVVSIPAEAGKKGARSPANSAQIECFKQWGASYDSATKRWTMYATERDAMGRLDAVRDCIARKTGAPRKGITIPEKWTYPGS
jgi:hypothetical protein